MKNTFLLFFLFLYFSGTAQEVTLLKGHIQADSLEGSSINIVNLSKEIGTTNNSRGQFEIEAEEGDTLLFSSVQYEIREIVISKEVIEKGFLDVELFYMMNELDEVKISNINLSGNLAGDLSNIETFDQASVGFPMSSKPRLTSIERKTYTAASASFDLILNMLNGRLKMLKKMQENIDYENLIDLGVDLFPAEFFPEYLHIAKENIRVFIYYCEKDPRFKKLLMKREALELIEFYTEKAEAFLELNSVQKDPETGSG